MTLGYMVLLTKCKKCDENYNAHMRFKKCPHNFRDKFRRELVGQILSNSKG